MYFLVEPLMFKFSSALTPTTSVARCYLGMEWFVETRSDDNIHICEHHFFGWFSGATERHNKRHHPLNSYSNSVDI